MKNCKYPTVRGHMIFFPQVLVLMGIMENFSLIQHPFFFFFSLFLHQFTHLLQLTYSRKNLLILEREREKETSNGCLSYALQPGIEPTTQVCALTGNQTANHFMFGMMLQLTEYSLPGATAYLLIAFHWKAATLKPLSSFTYDGIFCIFILFPILLNFLIGLFY